jgi:cytochrome c-type biogenesis protein CcmE
MSKKMKRVVITSAIVLVLLGYLVYSAMGSSFLFYKTVSELKTDASLKGESARIGGKVVKGSLASKSSPYRFKITDGKANIQIVYEGTLPASFRDDTEVIAEGVYQDNGEFKAKTILVKCPSKYEEESKKENK